jgi:hypothetical protein
MTRCNEPGCVAEHPAHHWANKRAETQGWFHQKDGRAWCPAHVPAWVAAWRAKRGGTAAKVPPPGKTS